VLAVRTPPTAEVHAFVPILGGKGSFANTAFGIDEHKFALAAKAFSHFFQFIFTA